MEGEGGVQKNVCAIFTTSCKAYNYLENKLFKKNLKMRNMNFTYFLVSSKQAVEKWKKKPKLPTKDFFQVRFYLETWLMSPSLLGGGW